MCDANAMIEPTVLVPTRESVLRLVLFCQRCQAKQKKPGAARADLEMLNVAWRGTEEGRAELFQAYQLLFPEVRRTICS